MSIRGYFRISGGISSVLLHDRKLLIGHHVVAVAQAPSPVLAKIFCSFAARIVCALIVSLRPHGPMLAQIPQDLRCLRLLRVSKVLLVRFKDFDSRLFRLFRISVLAGIATIPSKPPLPPLTPCFKGVGVCAFKVFDPRSSACIRGRLSSQSQILLQLQHLHRTVLPVILPAHNQVASRRIMPVRHKVSGAKFEFNAHPLPSSRLNLS